MGAIAGFALQGVSMIIGGMGQAAAQQAEAAKAERAKQVALIQADQTDAAYRDDLNTTIANIKAIRASTGADPNSPTTDAFIDTESAASERVRRIKVGGIRMQATQYGLDAQQFRNAAQYSLLGGFLGGLSTFSRAFA